VRSSLGSLDRSATRASRRRRPFRRLAAALLALALVLVGPLAPTPARAQEEEPSYEEPSESAQVGIVAAPLRLELVDTPTAQVLPRGGYDIWMRLLAGGDALFGARVGMFDMFTFGVSYGGSRILGDGDPDWNPRIEFNAKLRLVREGNYPGLAIGYDSQGLGPYDDELERYEMKSRGFYAAVDRSFDFLGYLGLHGGSSVSLENEDGEKGATFFFGLEKSLGNAVLFVAEYDLGLNDNKENGVYGEGGGFLNTGLTWNVNERFALDLAFRNLSENGEGDARLSDWNREVRVRFMEFF
jgi:hypothetical protein